MNQQSNNYCQYRAGLTLSHLSHLSVTMQMGGEEEDTKALEFIATFFSGYTQHCSSFISNQNICHH